MMDTATKHRAFMASSAGITFALVTFFFPMMWGWATHRLGWPPAIPGGAEAALAAATPFLALPLGVVVGVYVWVKERRT